MPRREFWALKRSSVRPALGKFRSIRYGSEEKFVPMPLPMTGERKTLVKSMKPRGVNVALPMRKNSGEGGSFPCGVAAAAEGAAEGAAAEGAGSDGAAAETETVLELSLVLLVEVPALSSL